MTQINLDQVFKDMLAAALGSAKSELPAVKSYLQQVMQNNKDVLLSLARSRLANQITDAQLQSELDDQKEALAAEMEGAEVIAAKVAEDALNAAINVLTSAVKTALTVG